MPPGGWPTDQVFDGEEYLFYRVHPNAWPDDFNDLGLDVFRMPDMSVNREKYGQLEWVIRGFTGWGAVKFKVRHIPPHQARDGIVMYDFVPIHDPLDGAFNYPHTEIRVFEHGRRVHAPRYDKEADYRWRLRLLRETKPAISPDRDAYLDSMPS